ncbi:hypothetical protein EVG20_g8996 [Dentipellis fragilis]|uniref:CNH domain-containing protein n=1 Tax=Dentipellis fragilis TaxID=205917 RepID=A0A4Y9Y616_9AGAM|nr:hypothetical protein EVG20_g8996 [Dentipellis fragilis]
MLSRRKSRPSDKSDKEVCVSASTGLLNALLTRAVEQHAGLPPFECEFDFEKLKANLSDTSKDPVSPICTGNDSIIHSGTVLYRREDEGLFGAWNELFLVLTDNHMLLAEPKQEGDTTKHALVTRPILLDLLVLSNFSDSPTRRITSYFNILKHTGVKSSPPASPLSDALLVYPFTIGSASGRQGDYTLYVETAQAREDWKNQLEAALRRRELSQASSRAFELKMVEVVPPIIPESDGETHMGKANCVILWATNDNRELIALGCDEGVWIGLSHKPKSLRRVLRVKSVAQIALMKDCGMFLVLTENVRLLPSSPESLVPSSPHNHTHNITQTPQRLSRVNNEVMFFALGYLERRTLIIYMSKKDNGSVFRVLEPDYIRIGNSAAGDPHLNGQQPNWFRIYRDFFLPSECHDLAFLESELAILCKTGFELMDWSNFENIVLPRSAHPQHPKLLSTCASSRPLAIFQCPDKDLLLCYDELGLYVNQEGDPNPAKQPIEWEGVVERIVHELETGKLCQIIRGERLRCICGAHNAETTARVYGTMNDGDAEDGEGQRIFELAPVVRQTQART